PNALYEFWARWTGTTTWVLLQAYSTNNQYHWNSTGAAPGTENFGVWAKDTSSSAAYDTFTSIPYTVSSPCDSATIAAAPTSVIQASGTHVTITGGAVNCVNPNPQFAFWLRPSTSPKWILLNGYTTTNTYDWNTTGAPVDTYYIGVWAKDGHSSNSYDAINFTTVTVT